MGRLGFAGRIIGIVLLLTIALVGINTARDLWNAERRIAPTAQFPLPAQAAAIAELFEALPEERRMQLLQAVSTERFQVSIRDGVPPSAPEEDRLPAIEWLVQQYLELSPERDIRAVDLGTLETRFLYRLFDRYSPLSQRRISIAIALSGGRYLMFEIGAASPHRVFGIPAGFWLGVFGALFAALALWAILREARPLRQLAVSVEDFSRDGQPRPVETRGAPDIRRLIDTVNTMQERISALIRGRTILLGAVSHDLKTYITRLQLRIEGLPDPAQRDKAATDLDGMTRLIEDSIAVAQGAAQNGRREPVNIGALLKNEVSAREGSPVSLAIADDVALVRGDEIALRRMFGNLIDNALRYGREAEIGFAVTGKALRITIDDKGDGIAAENREAVFEPFFRLETSRNLSGGGSGLGLTIAKQIVEDHGGRITIAESPSGGARLLVTLPVHNPEHP